jgi:hypothetical protein
VVRDLAGRAGNRASAYFGCRISRAGPRYDFGWSDYRCLLVDHSDALVYSVTALLDRQRRASTDGMGALPGPIRERSVNSVAKRRAGVSCRAAPNERLH